MYTACSSSFDFSRSGVLCVLVFVILGNFLSLAEGVRGGIHFHVHGVFHLSVVSCRHTLPISFSAPSWASRANFLCADSCAGPNQFCLRGFHLSRWVRSGLFLSVLESASVFLSRRFLLLWCFGPCCLAFVCKNSPSAQRFHFPSRVCTRSTQQLLVLHNTVAGLSCYSVLPPGFL
jgi:hypothetical protein